MANLNLRNIPDPAYKKIKKLAALNRRSVNSEIIYILTDALESHGPYNKKDIDLLSKIIKMRKKKSNLKKYKDSTELIRGIRD